MHDPLIDSLIGKAVPAHDQSIRGFQLPVEPIMQRKEQRTRIAQHLIERTHQEFRPVVSELCGMNPRLISRGSIHRPNPEELVSTAPCRPAASKPIDRAMELEKSNSVHSGRLFEHGRFPVTFGWKPWGKPINETPPALQKEALNQRIIVESKDVQGTLVAPRRDFEKEPKVLKYNIGVT